MQATVITSCFAAPHLPCDGKAVAPRVPRSGTLGRRRARTARHCYIRATHARLLLTDYMHEYCTMSSAFRRLQVDASDFANVAFLGRRLHEETLPKVVSDRLGVTPKLWAFLREARAQAQKLATAYRDAHSTTADEVDALVDELVRLQREEPAAATGAVAPPAPAASAGAAGSAASDAPSGGGPLPARAVDTGAEFERMWRGVLRALSAPNIVPAVYFANGDLMLARELQRLLELAATGVRVSGAKQAIFAGHPGIGKTTLMLYIASVAAVCFPSLTLVYWMWEQVGARDSHARGSTARAPQAPASGGAGGAARGDADADGAADGAAAGAAASRPADADAEAPPVGAAPAAAARAGSAGPGPVSVADVIKAAVDDPGAMDSASDFATAVMRVHAQGAPHLRAAVGDRCVVFLGDELQNVYETAAAYPAAAARLVGELREAGKMGNVVVAVSGSSTKMGEYTMTPSEKLHSVGIVDLNHGIYGVQHVSPPRTVAMLDEYMKVRFPPAIRTACEFNSRQLLHITGGVGRDVARIVLENKPLVDNVRLLKQVNKSPALRALFLRLAGLYPVEALNAAVDEDAPLGLVSVSLAVAVDIVQRAGEANGLAFLDSMVASGFLFMSVDNSKVEPMKTRDIAYVTRQLLGNEDPSALLCIQLMLAAQKHETYWTKIESYLRGKSRFYWDHARARNDVYLRFDDGHLCESSSPDKDAKLTVVTRKQLKEYISNGVPLAWVNEQGIDIVAFSDGARAKEVLIHFAQLKCGNLDIEFGAGDMALHDESKSVSNADKRFAPVLVNFKRGVQQLLPQLEAAFKGMTFVPSTFRLFTSKRWGAGAQALLDSYKAAGFFGASAAGHRRAQFSGAARADGARCGVDREGGPRCSRQGSVQSNPGVTEQRSMILARKGGGGSPHVCAPMCVPQRVPASLKRH
jgi:hypothetical protein